MKVYVVEYFGGSYSDYWCMVKGVFSTAERAKEYVVNNKPASEDSFTITMCDLDGDYELTGEAIEFWIHRPEIVPGAQVRIIKVTSGVGQKAKTYLNQIGTVSSRGSNIYVKFSEKGREYGFPISCVEAV